MQTCHHKRGATLRTRSCNSELGIATRLLKSGKKCLCTHVASQVFMRRHGRHFWPAVNEKPFDSGTARGGSRPCLCAGTLPGVSEGEESEKVAAPCHPHPHFSVALRCVSLVRRAQKRRRDSHRQPSGGWCLTSDEVRLSRCNMS